MVKISFASFSTPKEGALALNVSSKLTLGKCAQGIDKLAHGQMQSYLDHKDAKDKMESPAVISHPAGLGKISKLVMFKLGEDPVTEGGKVASALLSSKQAFISLEGMDAEDAAKFAFGTVLRTWKFDKYLTSDEDQQKLTSITLMVDDPKAADLAYKTYANLLEGINLTKEVISEPGNVIYPESLANVAKTLDKHGVKVEIFTQKELQKMGFHAMVGVAQGSVNEARLVVLQWNGGKKDEKPVCIVGKGVTFDSGGISIKSANKMEEMKWDMGGSGVVVGLLKALALNKVKANVVGIMGLVENMPSGSAQRPGDIVKSLSGKTIEVINTDAEGRLVLADCLWYAQDRFKPKAMVDLATLTMAVILSVGHRYAGLFGNDDKLLKQIEKSSKAVGEKVWHLPMDKEFAKALKADQADVRNSDYNVGAGSTMAAQFLECFVNDVPWVHLDIAGVAWSSKASHAFEKGATGYGVRLLYNWISENHAS